MRCLVTTATTPVAKANETPQRVQIMRSPDGRLTVKGLMPGQQLVQMPDGKLQVLTTTPIQQTTTTTVTPKTPSITTQKAIIKPSTPTGKLVLQGNQLKTVQQTQPQSPTKTQQIIVKQPATPVIQKIANSNTVVVSGTQVLQQQVVVSGQPVISSTGQQQVRSPQDI